MFTPFDRLHRLTNKLTTSTTSAVILAVMLVSGCSSEPKATSETSAAETTAVETTAVETTAVETTAGSTLDTATPSSAETPTTAPAVTTAAAPTTQAPPPTAAPTVPPAPTVPATPATTPPPTAPTTVAPAPRSADVEAFCTDYEAFGLALYNNEYDAAVAVMEGRAADLTARHPSEAADIAACLQFLLRGG